jgi:hypothetical protein
MSAEDPSLDYAIYSKVFWEADDDSDEESIEQES